MKKNLFILCIAFVMTFVSCNNNEPEGMPVQDGKVSFTIPAPALTADGGNQVGARKIYGNLTEDYIVFSWEENDEITFIFYDANEKELSTIKHIVTAGEIIDEGASINIKVDAPNSAKYATAATGPETIPLLQYHEVDGMHSNHMRFETDGKIELKAGENHLPMYPIWTALIITPTYTYYFDGIDNDIRKYLYTTIGMQQITLTQTIGSKSWTFEYKNLNRSGKVIPITKQVNNGGTPSTPYIIVVYPTEACYLEINLEYDITLFKGKTNEQWEEEEYEEPFNLKVNTEATHISTISMHTNGQSVTNLIKGYAYDIDPVQGHPIIIHWMKDN